jgi:signal transduction histidine kinase
VLLTYNVPFQSDVVKNLAPDMPLIYCLPGKLNQVFMNLFSNALYALQKVEREFRKELRITTSFDDEYVYVQVDDDGQGMTPETKNKIFEPFFTTKDVGEGTGLGMSIVYKIMETHQAKIDVESEFGVGTKIKLTLKRKLTI